MTECTHTHTHTHTHTPLEADSLESTAVSLTSSPQKLGYKLDQGCANSMEPSKLTHLGGCPRVSPSFG